MLRSSRALRSLSKFPLLRVFASSASSSPSPYSTASEMAAARSAPTMQPPPTPPPTDDDYAHAHAYLHRPWRERLRDPRLREQATKVALATAIVVLVLRSIDSRTSHRRQMADAQRRVPPPNSIVVLPSDVDSTVAALNRNLQVYAANRPITEEVVRRALLDSTSTPPLGTNQQRITTSSDGVPPKEDPPARVV